jgi:hypothetical protein
VQAGRYHGHISALANEAAAIGKDKHSFTANAVLALLSFAAR